MPRLSISLLRRARAAHPFLPLLLPACRNLHDARNELRWLKEYADAVWKKMKKGKTAQSSHLNHHHHLLLSMVRRRATGSPLQYILRSQPFGDLDILCRPGVLIPRPETEAYTYQTAHLVSAAINNSNSLAAGKEIHHLRLIDLCTGTGCIPLLLHSLICQSLRGGRRSTPISLSIDAIDIEHRALRLANRNISHNISQNLLSPHARREISLHRANVFNLPALTRHSASTPSWLAPASAGQLLVLTSNPPYISPKAYRDGTTARSVRLFEPKKALVPPLIAGAAGAAMDNECSCGSGSGSGSESGVVEQADLFYCPIIELSRQLNAHLTVLECGDPAQARRVARLAADDSEMHTGTDSNSGATGVEIEIWRCDGEGTPIACRHDSHFNGFDMQWCTVANDEADTKERGARIVVLKRPPFTASG